MSLHAASRGSVRRSFFGSERSEGSADELLGLLRDDTFHGDGDGDSGGGSDDHGRFSLQHNALVDVTSGRERRGGATDAHKLGMVMGVFIPCCLNIFGIILFLRLGWICGQSGSLALLFGMLLTAYLVDLFTTLSISALATSGQVKGGGAYYVISRSLGSEFGGATGTIFFAACVTATTLYALD